MLDRLRRAIAAEPDSAACETCLEQLDEYIAAQLADEDYTDLFPQVIEHLDSCVSCASAYARLYELEETARADALPTPKKIPAPDLSHLSEESLPAILSRHVQEEGERIRLRLSEALLALLVPSPAPAPTRSGGRYDRVRYQLPQEQATEAGLPLHFQVYADSEQPGLGLVEITVEPPGQSWPNLGGQIVILSYADETIQETTDAWGIATFPDILLDQLGTAAVEITTV